MMVLVTGGAGYIGSHTCVELLNAGYDVAVIDNFINSKPQTLEKIQYITKKNLIFYEGDAGDKRLLSQIFAENKIDVVIHFAALKAVGESVARPLEYYHNNILTTVALCEVMQEYNVKKMVFSSSATVYGNPKTVPIREDFPTSATNPYGKTKLMTENILEDICVSDPGWHIALLRYFNPIGAHESGLIGEDPNGVPNNLLPYVADVAIGRRKIVSIFGNDYPTKDGTGVRDYIHVVDLAAGHVKAVERVMKIPGIDAYNLGTGRGYSVLEVIKAFSNASGREIPYQITPRRKGDIAICYADTQKAERLLNWKAERNLRDMCEDAWRFAKHQWGSRNE